MSVRTRDDRPSGGRDGRNGRERGRGLPSAPARFETRAARVRRRPWVVAAVVVVVLAVLAGGAWVVSSSSLLATRTVQVTGLSSATERAAVTAAAGITTGTPLARVDTSGAADRIRRISTVATVEVQRTWPDTVTIVVTRKTAVLAVRTPDGTIRLVDASGSPFESVSAVPKGIALVTSSAATPDPAGLQAAASVLQILPAGLRAQVTAVTVTSADLVTFQLGSVAVTWGGLVDGEKKLRVLQVLLPTTPKTIDVSAPDTPTTT